MIRALSRSRGIGSHGDVTPSPNRAHFHWLGPRSQSLSSMSISRAARKVRTSMCCAGSRSISASRVSLSMTSSAPANPGMPCFGFDGSSSMAPSMPANSLRNLPSSVSSGITTRTGVTCSTPAASISCAATSMPAGWAVLPASRAIFSTTVPFHIADIGTRYLSTDRNTYPTPSGVTKCSDVVWLPPPFFRPKASRERTQIQHRKADWRGPQVAIIVAEKRSMETAGLVVRAWNDGDAVRYRGARCGTSWD